MKNFHLANGIAALGIALTVTGATRSLTGQVTGSIPKRSYSVEEATNGIVITANTHAYFRCADKTQTPIQESPEISKIRFWIYEYVGGEPPFTGKFYVSTAQLVVYPNYQKINTLKTITGGKRYYMITQKNMFFRCGEGFSIPKLPVSSSSSSKSSQTSSVLSRTSSVPTSSSNSSTPFGYCSSTQPCQSGMQCISNRCMFVDDCSSGFGNCSRSSSSSLSVIRSSSSSSYPAGYCSESMPCPTGQRCLSNRCAFVDDCSSGFGTNCSSSSSSRGISSISSSKPPVCPQIICIAVQPGCSYGVPTYDQNGCQTSCGQMICPSSSSSRSSSSTSSVKIDIGYKVGVNFHSTTDNFLATDNTGPFIKKYHVPGVREEVLRQLQGIADEGAYIIKTGIWFVDNPEKRDPLNWRLAFPISTQEIANMKKYAEDVASIQAKDGHRLELIITQMYLGCGDYHRDGTLPDTFGWCNLPWSEIVSRTKASVDGVADAVKDVKRPDGKKVVTKIYFLGEVMIGAEGDTQNPGKKNEERFLRDIYPHFHAKMLEIGIEPSLYFILTGREDAVFEDTYIDKHYSVLNGHKSLYWLYRTTEGLRRNNIPIPNQLDFSFYTERVNRSEEEIIKRAFDDLAAVYPGKTFGVVETRHPSDELERKTLGAAFAKELLSRPLSNGVIFWTTPNGSGPNGSPRPNIGYPFDIGAYKASDIAVAISTCTVGKTCAAKLSWKTLMTTPYVQLRVSMDGAPSNLVACNVSGTRDINWLQLNHEYKFTLVRSSSCTATDTITVLDQTVITPK